MTNRTSTGMSAILRRVRRLGKFMGVLLRRSLRRASVYSPAPSGAAPGTGLGAVQGLVKALGQRGIDARDAAEIVHAGVSYPLQAPKVGQERPTSLGSDTLNALQGRLGALLTPPLSM